MKVWITRARPAAEATAARLAALGFTPLIVPLLEVRSLPASIDLAGIDAIVFTSLNGVSAFAALSPARDRPVFAVGDATAQAASAAGFTSVRSANGDLTALATLIRDETRGSTLLHASAVQPAGDLAALVGDAARVHVVPVYESVETAEPPPADWDAVLIHSPRAARALASISPDVAGRIACAISRAAAAPLRALPFADIRIAPRPDEPALIGALGKPGPAV